MTALGILPSGSSKPHLELKALRFAENTDPEIASLRNRLADGERIVVREGIDSGSSSFLGELWGTLGFFLTGRVERGSDIVLTCQGFRREAQVRYASCNDKPRSQLEILPLRAVHFSTNGISAEELLIAAKKKRPIEA